MAHRSAPRTVGRHREETLRRHRAGAPPAPSPRAMLVTATLGAALIAGLTGGTAAHAADRDPAAPTRAADQGPTVPAHTADQGPTVPAQAADQGPTVPTRTADQGPTVPTHAADRNPAAPARADTDDVRSAIGIASPAEINEAVAAATGKSAPGAPSATASRGAQSVRKKNRPEPVVTTSKMRTAATDAAWVNPLPAARTTSCFGQRWGRLHAGVDLAAPNGTPIVATGAGVVVRAGEEGGYGNAVLIDHGNGYLTHYGHMSTIAVRAGQRVATGEQIGTEGSTGHSTGPHLHFEVHAGSYKNPIEPTGWLADRGVIVEGC